MTKQSIAYFQRTKKKLDMDIEIRMADTILKRTRTPKLLGVVLDEKLTFQENIKEVKAQKVLSALRVLGKTEKIDPTNMIRLYKSIVVPQLEYTASVWQS